MPPAAYCPNSVALTHITLPDIFRAFLPFICIHSLIPVLVFCVPEITTVFL